MIELKKYMTTTKGHLVTVLFLLMVSTAAFAQPNAPSGLVATTTSTTVINLTWTDNSSNETGFMVERSTSSGTGFTQINLTAANVVAYSSTGLTPGVKYYFRVRSTNGTLNSAYTSEASATTLLIAPTALAATAVSTTGINLTWTDNSSNETGYQIERSLTTATGFSVVTTTAGNTSSFSDTGLSAGVRYFYKIKAVNATGSSSYTSEVNATAWLVAPTSPTATAVSTTAINLTWIDNATNEAGYTVEKSTTSGSGFASIGTTGPNAVNFSSSGLTAGVKYYYRVKAIGATGSSAYSAEVSATAMLTAPTSLTATAVSTSGVNLTWVDNSSNETGYQIERSLTTATGFSTINTTAANTNSFSDTGLSTGVLYYYRVKAVNTGSSSYSLEASAMAQIIAPTSLVATTVSTVQINLTWIDNSSNEGGFAVERSLTSGSGFTNVTNLPANTVSYSNTSNTPGTQYFYRIKAINGPGSSAYTAEANATAALSTPTALAATVVSSAGINLSWTDNSANETGYQVERSLTTGTGFSTIASIAVNSNSYSDTGLSNTTKYYYRIKAFNATGASAYSSEVNGTTFLIQPTALLVVTTATTSAAITWTDNSSNETGFKIERSLTTGTGFTVVNTTAANSTSYTNTGLTAATNYFYRIRAANATPIYSAYTPEFQITTSAPAAPITLAASTTGPTAITLTWTDNSYGESGFKIERSLSSSNGFVEVATAGANATSYTDTGGLVINTTYYYKIRSTNAVGNSSYTSVVSSSTETGLVADIVEFNALKDLYLNTNGAGWLTKTNWPTSWPASATSAQFGTWAGVTVTNGDITEINLPGNNLIGPLPASIGNLTNLIRLIIYGNGLTGSIPPELGNLIHLTTAYMWANSFSGTVPGNLKNCVALQELGLSNNNLTVLEDIGGMPALNYLGLDGNNLTGAIPAFIGNFPNLWYLYLQNNKFTGPLPSTISSLTGLFYLNVSDNHLTGSLPDISGMSSLQQFYANNNEFSGSIPTSYSTAPLSNMLTIQFSGNKLSGSMFTLSGYTSLLSMTISYNNFTGAFPDPSSSGALIYIEAGFNHFTSVSSAIFKNPNVNYISFYYSDITTVTNLVTDLTNNALNLGAGASYSFDQNYLDFSVLEAFNTIKPSVWAVGYAPQHEIKDIETVSIVNNSFTIPSRPMGANSTIVWEKLVNGVWTNLATSTQNYVNNSAVSTDEGQYRWRMTNSVVTTVTLQSAPISVKTQDRLKLDSWGFQYQYDARKRMIKKKVPGAEWVYMVYDERDRLVFTQDGEQRKSSQWNYTQYDTLNRPIITGIYTHPSGIDQAAMSALVSTSKFCESYNGQLVSLGYTFSVFNLSNFTGSFYPLTATYYDNYAFKSMFTNHSYHYYAPDLTGLPTVPSSSVTGKLTGAKVRVLKNNGWLKSVSYYDDKYRTIQVINDNVKGGTDRMSNLYDFPGRVMQTKSTHRREDLKWRWQDRWWVSLLSNTVEGLNNSAITSGQVLAANTDGWIEFNWQGYDGPRAAGFSVSGSDPSEGYLSIAYSIVASQGSAYIAENGVAKPGTNFASSEGDVLKIQRVGNTLSYYRNGTLLTSTTLGSAPALRAGVGFSGVASIQDIRSSFMVKDSINEVRTFEYDHMSRLTKTWHRLNGGTNVLLVKNEYNELGQLVDKKLHSTNGTAFKQSIDYRYNIRGWLTSVNNEALTNDNGLTNDDTSDLFGMRLGYNNDLGSGNAAGNSAQYNGNISGMTWNKGLAKGATKSNAYNYSYDPMNRITAATFLKYSGVAWSNIYDAFSENGYAYDLNGNIKALTRHDDKGNSLDQLTYSYGSGDNSSNKLLAVSDAGDLTKGFVDGNIGSTDYLYDDNGNMVVDKNKAIAQIKYNHLNLPQEVMKPTGDAIRYFYDAGGRKVGQQVVAGSFSMKKKTDYAGLYFYENDTLKFINHEEGRIVMTAPSPEYQYHLKDHLGNVRTTFTSLQSSDITTATLETANQVAEYSQYLRYSDARVVYSDLFDHTNGVSPGYSERLNGSTYEKYGLARSLSVMPGDTINLEVYAKYLDPTRSDWTGTAFQTIVQQVAAHATNVVIDGVNYVNSTASFPGGLYNITGKTDGGAPKAYLNWIIFDRNFQLITFGYKQITTAAKVTGNDIAHEWIQSGAIPINEAGYVYAYLNNESASPVEVYFDDFKVTHIKSPVIQTDDYYPFGLAFNSYKRENNVSNNYTYNGKELQDELNLGWLDYGARMYEPEIGRWHKMDKKAELYANMSAYAYAANTPINAIDPDGNLVIFINGLSKGDGGTRGYWQDHATRYVISNQLGGGVQRVVTNDFAKSFTKTFDENLEEARFYDGAPRNEGNPEFRFDKGYERGKEDVADIITSLAKTDGVITEPLILATHSLGAAYGRGLLKAIIEYVKAHPKECVGLSISVYDFDPYNGSFLQKVDGVNITQILHKSRFGLANEIEPGANENDGSLIDDTKASVSHNITSFIGMLNRLEPGTYEWNGSSFVKTEERKKKD